jgi:DNA-binding response OmpR family regulator
MMRRNKNTGGKLPVGRNRNSINGQSTAVAIRPRRALIVEADPGTRAACVAATELCGLVADIVENGVTAVSSARQNPPDLIIVDMQLRDSAGLEVIRWLRSNPTLKSTPTVVLTTNAGDVSRSEQWEVDAILLKPLTFAKIESTIRGLLAAA